MKWTVILLVVLAAFGGHAMNEETSVEWVCERFPERVESLFAALDVDRPGLESVKQSLADGNRVAACEALLDYYRNGTSAKWLRGSLPEPGAGTVAGAEPVLDDTFTFYTLTSKVPRTATGGLDWHYRGPNDDREWAWALNRHSHLAKLLKAYQSTGNPTYVRSYDENIRDWVTSNPYPGRKSSTGPWRGLEAHFRVRRWAEGFYALQDSAELSPAARILLLSSIPEHAHYLRNFHADSGNWVAMEMNALAVAGVCWPEFREAQAWLDYAIETLSPEFASQVYPDGAQKELTSHYHLVTLANFEPFLQTVKRGGRKLPDEFSKTIERMWNYTAYSMRPDGHGPLNNDSDLDNNRGRVLDRAKDLDRDDWAYIATNGQRGKRPEGQPSVVFPWAGQLVTRSGWEADAHWAFFDFGPMGIGHRHWDKLHLSVAAFGRDLLVDSGRYTYVGGPFRDYFTGSAGHNLILVDGRGQNEHDSETESPFDRQYRIEEDYDIASGTFDKGFKEVEGRVEHTRTVVYVRGKYWVVIDNIETDRPRRVQPLWHFHPECTVAVEGNSVVTTDPGVGNVRVTPSEGAH
jgi:heparinase II/III-like protein